MFARELDKRRLLNSLLGMRWHLRDLVGSGILAQSQTTSGLLLRVVKKL
jgi:serine/threonine-protein kinase 19